jgi:hypothetical protein
VGHGLISASFALYGEGGASGSSSSSSSSSDNDGNNNEARAPPGFLAVLCVLPVCKMALF